MFPSFAVLKFLLIPIPVLFTAIRAFPGNSVAGHAPKIIVHAFLAYGEPAPAIPAEHELSFAALTLL